MMQAVTACLQDRNTCDGNVASAASGSYSLVQALPLWRVVQEVGQQLGHEHAKAHWVDQAQTVHALAVQACQAAGNEGACSNSMVTILSDS